MKRQIHNIRRMELLIICLFFLFITIGCSNSMKFSHNQWLSAKDQWSWNVRKKMAQDLVDSKMLIGMSKQEVINTLGEPEDYSDIPSNELYYTIECDYGHDIDPVKIEYLIITLDSKDQVTSINRKIVLDK